MSFALFTHGSVVLVEWGTPEMTDVEPLLEEVRRVRARGRPVFMVGHIAENAPAPSGDVHRVMNARMEELASLCSTAHGVFEGNGFFVAFKRSVLTGMIFASKGLRKKPSHDWRIHASFESVIQHTPGDRLAELHEVLKAFYAAPRHWTPTPRERSSPSPRT